MAAKRRLTYGTPKVAKRTRKTRAPGRRALRLVRALARKVEVKHHELSSDGAQISASTTPSYVHLTGLNQGDAHGQRDGRRVNLRSLHMRYRLEQADNPYNYVRIVIFRRPVGDDDNPDWAEIFDNSAPANLDFMNPLRQEAYRSKYRIYYNRLHRLKTEDVGGVSVAAVKYGTVRLKLKDIPVQYSGPTNVQAAVEKNQMWMAVVSDSGAVSHPTMDYHLIVSFTDS